MKKLLSFLLALALVFSLTGCGAVIDALLMYELPTEDTVTFDSTGFGYITEDTGTTDPTDTTDPTVATDPTDATDSTDATEPTATEPPVTEPPATKPPVTEPPATEPPVTKPPVTEPPVTEPPATEPPTEAPEDQLDPDGSYTTKEDVALYLHLYGKLPKNFITKNEARKLGWDGGSLEPYAPGMCIGGDRFGNYEGLLPRASGRTYKECDIGTLGKGSRGAKRIVFSNDGLIYYTDDHYESFTLLYGEE